MSKDPKEILKAVDRIVERHMDDLYTDLDNLHRKNIDDNQVKTALVQLGYASMADWYDEWMNDGEPLKEDAEDDGAPQGIVIDPINASSYAAIPESKDPIEREHYRAEASVYGPAGWNIYKKRSKSDNGAFIGKWPTRTMAIEVINTLQKGGVGVNESREYQIVHFTDAELEAAAEEAESVVESWGGYENALIRALDKLGIQRHPEVKESK